MITDGYGVVVERRSYDTWGQQRKVTWREDGPLDVVQQAITNRGYTGHEEIVEVGLVHMNGRVYDQELGRFLSADPLVQAPYVTNSYNRYAYVWNNPVKYNDPSGYIAMVAAAAPPAAGIAGAYNGNVEVTNRDINDAIETVNAVRAGLAYAAAKRFGATDEQAATFANAIVNPSSVFSEKSEEQAENALDVKDQDGKDEDEIDSFEKLVKSAEPIKGAAGGAEQYEKNGDADDAFRDFRDATDRETEKDISQRGRNQKIAKDKKDGKTVTYREKSRGDGDYDGASIVEKQNSSGKQTKVRYNKKESD